MQPNGKYAELNDLLSRLCDAELDRPDWERLETLLLDDPDAQGYYSRFVALDIDLAWRAAENAADSSSRPVAVDRECEIGPAFIDEENEPPHSSFPSLSPPPSLSTARHPLSSNFVGGPVFSYMVATVVLCVMLLSAWAYKITHDQGEFVVKPKSPSSVVDPEYVFVGQVTDMHNCVWRDDNTATIVGASTRLGRKYSLAAGLMEITYKSGAVVILEGPCDYTVDSNAGGYLKQGKLVARVEKKVASGQWPVARNEGRGTRNEVHESPDPQSPIPNPQSLAASHQPLATGPSSLIPPPSSFTVTTPTAVVTDLGTEFGVEVAENGDTTSHVFRGSVRVQSLNGNNKQDVVLRANESARVQCGEDGKAVVACRESFVPGTFVCRMPQWTPFEVFNTGVGLKEGEADPHWQIVARSDEPKFKNCPAVITSISGEYSRHFRQNDPSRSQWISTGGDMPTLTEGITFSFRTTFELAGVLEAASKSIILRGGFMADNHVTAIRLNGKEVPVPEHGYQAPFNYLFRFAINDGFVEGTNVLEFDVLNEAPGERSLPVSPMALRVELDGRILRGGRTASADSSKTFKTKAGKEERK